MERPPLCNDRLFCFVQHVYCATDADELGIFLKVQRDGSLFDLALFENALDDFLFGHRVLFAEEVFDNVGDGSLFVSPFLEGVQAASDENELVVTNKFIVDGLSRDEFLVKASLSDLIRDVHEVERILGFVEVVVGFYADSDVGFTMMTLPTCE